jgi:RimJ/RimL family protein N-acetyltransferase
MLRATFNGSRVYEYMSNCAEVMVAAGNTKSIRSAEKIGAHEEWIRLSRVTIGKVHADARMYSVTPSELESSVQLRASENRFWGGNEQGFMQGWH